MRIFTLFDSMITDGPTDGQMDQRRDGRTDKASYRGAYLRLKKASQSLQHGNDAPTTFSSFFFGFSLNFASRLFLALAALVRRPL